MTKSEVASLIALLKEYYPRDISNTDAKTRVAAWHYVLADYPYDLAKAGVVSFVSSDTRGFPPSVGQIVEQISKLTTPPENDNELAAWDKVRKAAAKASMSPSSRKMGDSRVSAERLFEELPKDIQAVVHSPEQLANWGTLPEETLNTVVQSNFVKSYRARRASSKEFEKLPAAAKEIAKELSGTVTLRESAKPIEG